MADIDKAISEACANNNELSGFKLSVLKRYLANRKQNVSGRKAKVIERVKGPTSFLSRTSSISIHWTNKNIEQRVCLFLAHFVFGLVSFRSILVGPLFIYHVFYICGTL